MFNIDPVQIVYIIPVVLLSLSFHEFFHAAVADMLGDPTPRDAGRLSLYPQKHLDPIGTIMIVLSTLAGMGIGWARPVPINPRNFRNYRRDTIFVSIAGPLANLLLSLIFAFPLIYIFYTSGPYSFHTSSVVGIVYNLSRLFFLVNISLAVFNIIPVPPLDGSKILTAVLPARQYYQFMQYENYIGLGFLMIIMIRPQILNTVMSPVTDRIADIIIKVVKPVINVLI